MNRRLPQLITALIVVVFLVPVSVAQDDVSGKLNTLDGYLKAGFDLLQKSKYADARQQFEAASALFDKKPEPSEWLFTKIHLKDEDPGDATSKDAQIRQITSYRHAMGTKQAITTFLAFTSQLQGDKAAADKYFDAIYKLRSVLWGLSWQAFIPPIQGFFHTTIPPEDNENYARYLYRSGLLLEDAGEEISLTMFEKAQKMAPKDPEIAANLASSYLMRLRAAEARSLATASLAIKPQQGRVLIDLATAEWLLGELDNAEKHATEAAALRPDLPGPHVTLALISIERGAGEKAIAEAAKGVEMSDRHPFYLAVQAAVFEMTSKKDQADQNLKEAYAGKLPTEDQLKGWFIKGKPLELLLTAMKRQK